MFEKEKAEIRKRCLSSESADPSVVLADLMSIPGVPMHGPVHHIIVGSALLAAYRNGGSEIDLGPALDTLASRGEIVPGAVCGHWGSCGAGLSAGMFASIVLGSGPLEGKVWRAPMKMTAACLERISDLGGPRCCKRDSILAVTVAAEFADREMGAHMTVPSGIVCGYSGLNPQCIGGECPFNPSRNPGRKPNVVPGPPLNVTSVR